MAASCLEECPNEILGQIFKTLPDFQTLKALVLTRPAFYSLFISDSARVIGLVVANEVSVELLPEAIAVLYTSQIDNKTTVLPASFSTRFTTIVRAFSIASGRLEMVQAFTRSTSPASISPANSRQRPSVAIL
ncbi:hypothetical protein EV356DRAFT_340789 [Viridothelium virens]|uniref:F-box domain-containing protein n=1 Tax=Viridothelium virens TaxID=1048519 RepID=A0A6A6GY48_VIRVR|nr:hypothetical protein EV356DRAFT_340789 [Viridothelium virens]